MAATPQERALGVAVTPAAFSPPDGAAVPAESLPSEAMSIFSAIALANGGAAGVEELLALVAQGAASLLGVSRCVLYLRDAETGLFRGECCYGATGVGDGIRGSVCGQEFDGLTREIVTTRSPVVVSNARQDPRPVRSAVLRWGLRALVGAPIVHDGDVIGLIYLDDDRRQRAFGPRDMKLLEVFTLLVSGVIARARETERLRDEARALNGQNRALQRTLAFGDRLALLVAHGAGLREVAATVAQFTGKACAIYDGDGQRRTMAGAPDAATADAEPPFPPTLASFPALAKAVDQARPGRPTVATAAGPDGAVRRLLLLRAPEETPDGATIVLEQQGAQRLQVLDAKVMRRAAPMVDLIVRSEIDRAECLRALTADLLLGHPDERLVERAVQHGLDLAAPRVVCLIGPVPAGGARGAGAVAAAFEAVTGAPTRLVVGVGGQVAVMLPLAGDAPAPEAVDRVRATVAAALAELGGDGEAWRAGLSSPCHQRDDYPHALGEARQALAAGAEMGDRVLAVDDLGPSHLLTSGIDAARAARFARAVMAPLLDDGSESGAALLATLETFFDCGRNIRQTAQRLEVHENTVRYRLGSVTRRTGLDIAGNPRDELTVQLALQLMRDGQRPSQRGGRFSANADAPSAASAEWKTGIASSS